MLKIITVTSRHLWRLYPMMLLFYFTLILQAGLVISSPVRHEFYDDGNIFVAETSIEIPTEFSDEVGLGDIQFDLNQIENELKELTGQINLDLAEKMRVADFLKKVENLMKRKAFDDENEDFLKKQEIELVLDALLHHITDLEKLSPKNGELDKFNIFEQDCNPVIKSLESEEQTNLSELSDLFSEINTDEQVVKPKNIDEIYKDLIFQEKEKVPDVFIYDPTDEEVNHFNLFDISTEDKSDQMPKLYQNEVIKHNKEWEPVPKNFTSKNIATNDVEVNRDLLHDDVQMITLGEPELTPESNLRNDLTADEELFWYKNFNKALEMQQDSLKVIRRVSRSSNEKYALIDGFLTELDKDINHGEPAKQNVQTGDTLRTKHNGMDRDVYLIPQGTTEKSFWKKFGEKISVTYNHAKDAAKQIIKSTP